MIKIENVEIVGLEHAIRGMRNAKNSWNRSDSFWNYKPCCECNGNSSCIDDYNVGQNDHELMMSLAAGGPVHAKYRRMIVVYADITAPLYWWKEYDTYKVGTVANSCSTMHKIHDKEFTLGDFSCEHLFDDWSFDYYEHFKNTICALNSARNQFLKTKDKKYWWQMIQLLPSSYNQKRTVMLNYEVLAGVYPMRKNHKLDELHWFCDWIKSLPYSEIIIGEEKEV